MDTVAKLPISFHSGAFHVHKYGEYYPILKGCIELTNMDVFSSIQLIKKQDANTRSAICALLGLVCDYEPALEGQCIIYVRFNMPRSDLDILYNKLLGFCCPSNNSPRDYVRDVKDLVSSWRLNYVRSPITQKHYDENHAVEKKILDSYYFACIDLPTILEIYGNEPVCLESLDNIYETHISIREYSSSIGEWTSSTYTTLAFTGIDHHLKDEIIKSLASSGCTYLILARAPLPYVKLLYRFGSHYIYSNKATLDLRKMHGYTPYEKRVNVWSDFFDKEVIYHVDSEDAYYLLEYHQQLGREIKAISSDKDFARTHEHVVYSVDKSAICLVDLVYTRGYDGYYDIHTGTWIQDLIVATAKKTVYTLRVGDILVFGDGVDYTYPRKIMVDGCYGLIHMGDTKIWVQDVKTTTKYKLLTDYSLRDISALPKGREKRILSDEERESYVRQKVADDEYKLAGTFDPGRELVDGY